MKIYYDLHIHSALSPCGDNDMTPCNIVNMAAIKGLNCISITDHNSCKNVLSAIKAAADLPLLVIPGMEVQTSEDVHMLCYFRTIEAAAQLEAEIEKNPFIKNREDIFGEQLIMDEEDNVLSKEERLLVNSCGFSMSELTSLCRRLGGVAIPAHIDKSAYSVISNLGFIPPEENFIAVEFSPKASEEFKNHYLEYNSFVNSDAHYLENISEPEYSFSSKSDKFSDILDSFFNLLGRD